MAIDHDETRVQRLNRMLQEAGIKGEVEYRFGAFNLRLEGLTDVQADHIVTALHGW